MRSTRTSLAARNVAIDALLHRADGGSVLVYTGIQPATPETPATGRLLATGTLGTPAFAPAVDGVAAATAVADEESIEADGDAGWFRVVEADGTTAVWDGTCGTVNANLLFDNLSLIAGARLTFPALTYAVPMQGA